MALCAPPGLKLNLASSTNESLLITRRMRTTTRNSFIVRMAASSDVVAYEEGQLERPKWAGETPLSRLVGALISFGPLSSVLKFGARQVLISTAEKKNIPWRKMTTEILESDVYKELENIQNPSIVYPDYYLNPFHAYDEGNLCWLAAAEAEAANMSLTRRALPNASSLDEACQIMRGNWLQEIAKYNQLYSRKITDILDIGCSVGVSTRYLSNFFPSANVTGLDLSPYFLSVAQYKEKRIQRKNPIKWIHANGEETGLPSQSFDLVSFAYMFHECPERAIINLLREAFRLLRPGGTIAVTDLAVHYCDPAFFKLCLYGWNFVNLWPFALLYSQNQRFFRCWDISLDARIIQIHDEMGYDRYTYMEFYLLKELSPVLFTLFKSTEPFLDEYCSTDLEGRMREVGFMNIQTVLTDPRHLTTTATVPH